MNLRDDLRFLRKLCRWYFSGNRDLTPPPARIKRRMLCALAREHGLRVLIETGTYQGGTITALRNAFSRIHSIELSPELARAAQERFAADTQVTVHEGDSEVVLPGILAALREPALFWLDAHYSEGFTARGTSDTPIRKELRAILSHPVAGHVIAIDDAGDFGKGDYPSIDEIRSEALAMGVGSVLVRNNMVIIEKTRGSGHAQSGEDAIVTKLFDAIGVEHHQCIEFGAWDGIHGSNTAHLWLNDPRWKALLIEANKERFAALTKNTTGYNAVCVNAYVGIGPETSIDALARQHGFGPAVDLLSIDIDGNDYWIFESLRFLKPRIVICEYNPTIPTGHRLIGAVGTRIGCSSASLIELAERNGYTLCAATYSNLIFVRSELADKVTQADIPTGTSVEIPQDHVRYVISDYDGDYSFSDRPTYGVRAPRRPTVHQSDMRLFAPHPLLAGPLSAYHSIRRMLYHFRRKLR